MCDDGIDNEVIAVRNEAMIYAMGGMVDNGEMLVDIAIRLADEISANGYQSLKAVVLWVELQDFLKHLIPALEMTVGAIDDTLTSFTIGTEMLAEHYLS